MNTNVLLNHLDSLELKGILPKVANQKIQEFLDYSTKSTGRLFLIMSGMLGAIFASAGIFALISHNWDDFPKHFKGALSIVPSLVALYFYYVALFKHSKSVVWSEAASLFLMLMIGASIALVAQTYQMNGDFRNFIKLWLVLTIPLFYLSRASGIALFYIPLSCVFLEPSINWSWFVPSSFDVNSSNYLFWLFFIPVLIHFYLVLNKTSRKQGFRAIFLGYLISITLPVAIFLTVQTGYIWWSIGIMMTFYLFGKHFFGENISHLGRPFQTWVLWALYIVPIYFTHDFFFDMIFKYEGIRDFDVWTAKQFFHYFTGIILMITMTIIGLLQKRKGAELNRYVLFISFLFVFLYFIYCLNEYLHFNMRWLGFFVLNFYILGFAINAMIHGNKSKSILYMFYGLFLAANLLAVRYFDMDISFWFKGILFIGVGCLFFLINYLSTDEFEN